MRVELMRPLLLAATALALLAEPAGAQTVVQPPGLPFSGGTLSGPITAPGITSTGAIAGNVTATGSTTARGLADRAADVVNVKDFGAKCDGVTDDVAAFNAAIAYAKASLSTSGAPAAVIVLPQGKCIIESAAINLTGIQSQKLVIRGNGTLLYGMDTGKAVIDALGSRWLTFEDITVQGDATNTPNVGVQIGRVGTTASSDADHMTFINLHTTGNFSLAAVYNNNSESTAFYSPQLFNNAANAYGMIFDGLNHFGVTSAYISQNQPANTPNSFNENVVINADIRVNGASAVPIWVGGTNKLRFVSSYAAATAGTIGTILYSGYSAVNALPDFDVHYETTGLIDVFKFDADAATTSATISGLKYRDQQPFNSGYIFAGNGTLTSITFADLDVAIGTYTGTGYFDVPNHYTVTGRLYVGAGTTLSTALRPLSFRAVYMHGNTYASGPLIAGYTNSSGIDNGAVVGGQFNQANSTACTVFGNNGYCGGNYSSLPGGNSGHDRNDFGVLVWSSGSLFGTLGGTQTRLKVLSAITSDTALHHLTGDGAAPNAGNELSMFDTERMNVTCSLVVYSATGTDTGHWTIDYTAKRDTGIASVSLMGTPAWVADTNNDAGVSVVIPSVGVDTTTYGRPYIGVTASSGSWDAAARCQTTEIDR